MPALSRLILPYPGDSRLLFSRLRHLPGHFLLLSCPGFEGARFDVFSALPAQQVRLPWSAAATDAEVQVSITAMIDQLALFGIEDSGAGPLPGWYGLASYDLYSTLHGLQHPTPTLALDRLQAGFYPSVLVVDHQEKQCSLVALYGHERHSEQLLDALLYETIDAGATPFRLTTPFDSNLSRDAYLRRFDQVQAYLHAGDCYQVNLAQRFSARCSGDPWDAFNRLASALAAPMASYFAGAGFHCLSLSPAK